MSEIQNTDELVTKSELSQFYQGIYPYLNGAAHAGFTPVGTVVSVMGVSAPANYLICNGQIVNIADYKELANYFEAQFGSKNKFGGDGTTTFAVPDLRGEFLRGTGTNSHANQGNGAAVGVHQDATVIPKFIVNPSDGATNNLYVAGKKGAYNSILNADKTNTISSDYQDISINKSSAIDRTGDVNFNYTTRPTNTSVLYCIATKNIYIDARFDYSTEEKVVGTWIDGKPLYQKTIEGTLPTETNEIQTFATHGITNIDNVHIVASSAQATDGTWYNIGITATLNVWDAWVNINNIRNKILTASLVSQTGYITLQYTKTTD